MSDAKRPHKATNKTISDIDKPGKTPPSATSKSVIVTNRPILKDPMVNEETEDPKPETSSETLAHTAGSLKPSKEPDQPSQPNDEKAAETPVEQASDKKIDKKPEESSEPENNSEEPLSPEKTVPAAARPSVDSKKPEIKTAEEAKHEADIQKLIDSKKYELPINAVEKRKTKHFVVLGVFLAILLVIVWADIALDAGLIKVSGVKPVTHFFSN